MKCSCHDGMWILRTLPLLVCLGVFGCSHGVATDPSNMMCVKRLQMPFYPPVPQAARTSIEVSAAITLTKDGTVQTVVLEGATGGRPDDERLFRPTIERTIRASAFEPACANKTVRISYAFRMNVAPDVTASWFGYPNRVEVWAVSPRFEAN